MSRTEKFRMLMSEQGYELTPNQAAENLDNFEKFVELIKGLSQSQIFDMLKKIKKSSEPTMFGEPLTDENVERILELLNDVKNY